MKLFKLRLTTLKSKLYAIVFASFVVRVVAFFMLPKSQNYAPDEGTYSSAVSWMLQNNPLKAFGDYGGSLFLQSRPLLYPATAIGKFGLSPLDSVRAISSTYGFLSLCILVLILLNTYQSFSKKIVNKIPILVLVYAFIPSHFLWSILGLRESATEFYSLLAFYAFNKFGKKKKYAGNIFYLIIMSVSITGLFTARRPVGLVFTAALLVYSLFLSNKKQKLVLLLSLVTASAFGYSATADFWKSGNYVFKAYSINETSSKLYPIATIEDERVASYICLNPNDIVTYHFMKFICKPIGDPLKLTDRVNPVKVLDAQISSIQSNHKVNQVGAASAIPTISCPIDVQNRIDNFFCIGWRAPYTSFTFLFRPILILDTTSTSSLIAGLENVFWLLAALYIIFMAIRYKKQSLATPLWPPLLFLFLYVTLGGAYEGNMGTAFRHKSLILWVIILLLASISVASQQRKVEHNGISSSSQE